MVFLSGSKVMVGDNTTRQEVSIEIRGPLASAKEHQLLNFILVGLLDGWRHAK